MRQRPSTEAILGTALALLLLALFGTYWDDAWHTDKGRDTFWSPPHLLLYAGIGLAGALVGLHALRIFLDARDIRAILRRASLVLALVGAAWTLASAPIDDAWHRAFGRDSALWSPPHLMGLIGVLLLVSGTTLELATIRTPTSRRLVIIGHSGIFAALASLVFEYDSDVPQFALLWYLPVLAASTLLAVGLIRLTTNDPWAASKASLAYTGLMVLVIAFLTAIHASAPLVPLVALAAFAHDAIAKRGHSNWAGVAYVLVIFATYPEYVSLFHIAISQSDLVIGVLLATLLGVGVVLITRPPRAMPLTAAALVVLLVLTPLASAHDPGQGPALGEARMHAHASGRVIALNVQLHATDCSQYAPADTVARRAGDALVGRLDRTGPCAFSGSVTVPSDGRWFVYARLRGSSGVAEAWIPIVLTGGEVDVERSALSYQPPSQTSSTAKTAASVVLYAVNCGLLFGIVAVARRTARGAVP